VRRHDHLRCRVVFFSGKKSLINFHAQAITIEHENCEEKLPSFLMNFMHNSGHDHCHNFANHVRDVFADGLRINDRDSHFILSTLPIDDLNQIDELIQDADSTEYDALMELIYFPDESTQINLEDQIESARFQLQDVNTILIHLMAVESDTHIFSPKGQFVLAFPTPESGARSFLQRLNLSRHLDPELSQTIEAVMDSMLATKHKVWIRNMTREPSKRDSQFLKRLFLKLGPQYQRLGRLVKFALRFLEETPAETELLQGLIQYKQRCLQHIQRLDRFESKRRNHNFETRIALGIREPHDDKQALMQKVIFLDEIGLAIFDRKI
jgi:hypothetical protein